jgi:hypothetical protein
MTQRKHKRLLTHLHDHTYALNIDNSSLERLTTCPRSAEYLLVHGRKEPASDALTYGQNYHTVMDAIARGERDLSALFQIAKDAFAANPVGMGWRNLDFMCDSIEKYMKFYAGNHIEALPLPDGTLFCERGFSLELATLPVHAFFDYPAALLVSNPIDASESKFYVGELILNWTGRIDMLTKINGELFVVDHKTSSMISLGFWTDFTFSNQMIGYTWAAQTMSYPTKGVLINVLGGRKPTPSGKTHEFARQRFNYDDAQIREWQRDQCAHVSTFVSHLLDGYFPKSTKWCQSKYGACKYFDVCSLAPKLRGAALSSSMFTENVWDPTEDSNASSRPQYNEQSMASHQNNQRQVY